MTTANKVTIFRILLIPFFVVEVLYYVRAGEELHRWLALATFLFASVCDGVDGYIARRYNQRSELGALLDPLADKLLLVSGVVLLSLDNTPWLTQLPLWFTGTVIGRDVLLLVGLVVVYVTMGKPVIRPRWIGKVATVLQMAAVLWILLKLPADGFDWVAAAAALCTGVSGVWYLLDGIQQLSAHPTSSATPPDK
ncbi:MAG: CDP-diacylglycerol--glycerol-3-phosphate 3-phosphatidyltransferase [Verrucomicrobia bacterium]|jgi:CDP-diacylglycerol--glycerol-3-phosphate 3-phosphatidyltransferase|nr:CDP-diacylglycerol--glycerol-3-phosphate 3-phosphatidyltransferase [Verrucomicrobiota bacterium]